MGLILGVGALVGAREHDVTEPNSRHKVLRTGIQNRITLYYIGIKSGPPFLVTLRIRKLCKSTIVSECKNYAANITCLTNIKYILGYYNMIS